MENPSDSAGAVRALARLVNQKESGHAADTRTTAGDEDHPIQRCRFDSRIKWG